MSNIVATNRKARRDFEVMEVFDCGIELKGSEVKSIRDGKINLDDSYARLDEGEIFLHNAHISPYFQASYMNVESVRPRKLLLHKRQIAKITGFLTQKGLTLIPLKVYFNERGYAKVELGVCKGKKIYDKRDDIKRRETDKEMRRILKNRRG